MDCLTSSSGDNFVNLILSTYFWSGINYSIYNELRNLSKGNYLKIEAYIY